MINSGHEVARPKCSNQAQFARMRIRYALGVTASGHAARRVAYPDMRRIK